MTARRTFQTLTADLGLGAPPPPGWRSLTDLPLLILVGVTGVGKSTLLAELAQQAPPHRVLPDRRDLTDQLIIPLMQAAAGLPPDPVTDRGQRFALTRRYREQYTGGMAHALTYLWAAPVTDAAFWLFDGLRGENEVTHAAAALPRACFVMLDAPDRMRVQRLLGRGDAFDRIAAAAQSATPPPDTAAIRSFNDLGIPDAAAVFGPADEQAMLGWLADGSVSPADLRAKLQIVVEERRSYDPAATYAALRAHAPARTLYLDTVAHAPAAIAAQVLAWLPAQLTR